MASSSVVTTGTDIIGTRYWNSPRSLPARYGPGWIGVVRMMSSEPSSRSRLTAVALMLIATRAITTISAASTVSAATCSWPGLQLPVRCRPISDSPSTTPAATKPHRPAIATSVLPRATDSRHATGLWPTWRAGRSMAPLAPRPSKRRYHGIVPVRAPITRTRNIE